MPQIWVRGHRDGLRFHLACASTDDAAAPEKDAAGQHALDFCEILRSRRINDLNLLENRAHFGLFLRAYTHEAEK